LKQILRYSLKAPMQQGNQAGVFIDSWGVQWAWAAGWGCTGAFSEYRKICFN
jgi:hypothetical protein